MKDTVIATWQDYSIVRTVPTFGGRAFYSISRNGRTISRTFNTKRAVTKAFRLLQGIQPYPLLDTKINWLTTEIEKYGACSL